MLRVLRLAVGIALVFSSLASWPQPDPAYSANSKAPSQGATCSTVGKVSANLICSNSSGIKSWKYSQKIVISGQTRANSQTATVLFEAKSTSGLPLKMKISTPDVCRGALGVLQKISSGKCAITLSQSGSKKFAPAISASFETVFMAKNEILVTPIKSARVGSHPYIQFDSPSSSSTKGVSQSPLVCTTEGTLQIVAPGTCVLKFSNLGDELFEPAEDVLVSFQATALPALTLEVRGLSTAGAIVSTLVRTDSPGATQITSETPQTCTFNGTDLVLVGVGTCQIRARQESSGYFEAAELLKSFSVTMPRYYFDQPDLSTGFQIKPLYVVFADGVDKRRDTDGTISQLLNDGNVILRKYLGVTFDIDRTRYGVDVLFKQSQMTFSEFQSQGIDVLADELLGNESPSFSRKDYVLFVEADYINKFPGGTIYCGLAGRPGNYAVVALGACQGAKGTLDDFQPSVWVHEVFHNLGVQHTENNSCDLMSPGGDPCQGEFGIDSSHTGYVHSSNQGVDVLTLRVWSGYNTRTDLVGKCLFGSAEPKSASREDALCATGTQLIGSIYCWPGARNYVLQNLTIDGSWKNIGKPSYWSKPWGGIYDTFSECGPGYYSPWVELTVATPGTQTYRWLVNGVPQNTFHVYWQQ